MVYRIIGETQKSGREVFYVERRFFYWFWITVSETVSMDGARQAIVFPSLGHAEDYIDRKSNEKYSKSESKIVKRKLYKVCVI